MSIIELLNARRHDRASFVCGERTLERYLREQATQHHRDGIATTHVLVDAPKPARILGYYTLSAAQLLLGDLLDEDRRRLPHYPVPAVRMGRLAVATAEQGRGYGEFLLAYAITRCLDLREQLGVRVLLVDALNDEAAEFYRAYGFRESVTRSRALYLPLGKA